MTALERRVIESLEQALRSRRAELLAEVKEVTGREEDEPFRRIAGEAPDSGDDSVAATLIDTDHAAVDRDLAEVRSIDRALGRMADGSYGRCSACGDEIAIERLRANPIAERCFLCQDHFEKTHRQENRPQL